MPGVHKPFNRDVYRKYDGPAKEAMRNHLVLSGHTVTVPEENFSVDLYSEVGPLTMYHEVEVFAAWQRGEFPFSTGSVPSRKIRLVKILGKQVPLYFWRLRADLARALVFGSHCLQDRFLTEVPNKEVATNEFFYRIPVCLGKEFDLFVPELKKE